MGWQLDVNKLKSYHKYFMEVSESNVKQCIYSQETQENPHCEKC